MSPWENQQSYSNKKKKKYRRALDDHAQILSMEITTEDEQEEEVEGEEKEKENKTKPFPSLSIWTHAIGKRNLPSQIESSRTELSWVLRRTEAKSKARQHLWQYY